MKNAAGTIKALAWPSSLWHYSLRLLTSFKVTYLHHHLYGRSSPLRQTVLRNYFHKKGAITKWRSYNFFCEKKIWKTWFQGRKVKLVWIDLWANFDLWLPWLPIGCHFKLKPFLYSFFSFGGAQPETDTITATRVEGEGGLALASKQDQPIQQHLEFPSSVSSKCYQGPILPIFSVPIGTGCFQYGMNNDSV